MESFVISCKAKDLQKAIAQVILAKEKNLLVKVQ